MPNIKICLSEVHTLGQSHQIARILNLRFLDYLPCTCKIPGQDYFWTLNSYLRTDFQNFCGTFLRLLECKRMTISYLYVGVLEQGDMQKGGFQRMV